MSRSFTVTMDTPGLLESIEAKLELPRPDCQIWPGATDQGYGRVWVDGLAKRVHRVVWELKKGPIPEGMTIDHLCRIRACCNVDHLEVVTNAENVRRAAPLRYGHTDSHCKNGHEWSDENTIRRRKSKSERTFRVCRTCEQARSARRRVERQLERRQVA